VLSEGGARLAGAIVLVVSQSHGSYSVIANPETGIADFDIQDGLYKVTIMNGTEQITFEEQVGPRRRRVMRIKSAAYLESDEKGCSW
jgi:hypothetical protein